MRLKSNLAADGALVVVTLIWGSTFVMAKEVLAHWPPLAYTGVRFVVASLALILLFPKQFAAARAREWKMGGILGALMIGGFTVQAVGQIYTTPSKSAFITGLTTPLVPFVALALLRVRPSFENLVGVLFASVGGILILMPREASINRGDFI
ncbi:MAG TPA: DMT family transporter, partial [Pyrinomonadaceae bacterium]|nr:DMT family transporter [Pyrinomonadaceae bacterium]